MTRLHEQHAQAQSAGDRAALASVGRDLRYWTARRSTAQLMPAPEDTEKVQFGSTVTIVRDDGRRQTFRIVGEDEAEPARGHALLCVAGRPRADEQGGRRRHHGRQRRGGNRRDPVTRPHAEEAAKRPSRSMARAGHPSRRAALPRSSG